MPFVGSLTIKTFSDYNILLGQIVAKQLELYLYSLSSILVFLTLLVFKSEREALISAWAAQGPASG